jgi:hypothetical protein
MTWTQAQVDALQAAIATGVKRVEYEQPNGARKVVEYHSIHEMMTVLATAQQSLNATAGKPAYSLIATRKGFDS